MMMQIVNLTTYTTGHHVNGKFQNEPTQMTAELTREGGIFGSMLTSTSDWKTPMPMREIDETEWATPGIRFWWIGHATCLFQFGDIFVLTDPVFSGNAGPVSFVMKRTTPSPITIDDLPPISYVLLSHDHYDHLDYASMKQLTARFPEMQILTGLGMAEMLRGWGMNAVAFDWRQEATIGDLTFTCMPARHWTTRKVVDGGKRLWCSFLIRYQGVVVYFPGDTAVGEHFAEVRAVAGKPVDLCPMPIGPKCPEKMMRPSHTDGVQAVDMALVLESARTVPIHWGLFPLGRKFPDSDKTDLDEYEETTVARNYGGSRVLKMGGMMEWNGEVFEVTNRASLLHE